MPQWGVDDGVGSTSTGGAGYRALLFVIAAALAVAGITAAVFSVTADPAGGSTTTLGAVEPVLVSVQDGTTVELRATMDSGADRSSIGTTVADQLGIDLQDADTVTVQSALGEEERPVVPVAITIGDEVRTLRVTVNDRSALDTAALVGRDGLTGYVVDVSQTDLTTPDSDAAPSAIQTVLAAQAAAVNPGSLLALLPVAALAVVVLRYVVGLSTMGTFTPVLLTLSFLQAGFVPALLLTVLVVGLGVAVEPLLRRHRMPRVARLAALIGLAATVFLVIEAVLGLEGAASSWGSAFPLVVSAGLVEKLYETWQADGRRDALVDTAWTVGVAAAVMPLLVAPPVRALADAAPWALSAAALVLSLVAGSYRGLRLTELVRFQQTAGTDLRQAGGVA